MDRYATCIFCDDLRQETGNKVSFMGVYASELNVRKLPALLTKFCVVTRLVTGIDDPPKRLIWKIKYHDIEKELSYDAQALESAREHVVPGALQYIESHEDEPRAQVAFGAVVVISPFELSTPGPLNVWAETDRENLHAGRIWVRQAEERIE